MIAEIGPDRAVRLLRAKASELEARTLNDPHDLDYLAADIALIAGLLADVIELASLPDALAAEPDDSPPLRTKSGKVLTDADIEALADEAERGYDVEHLRGAPNRDR